MAKPNIPLAQPSFDLDPPGTYVYNGHMSSRGYALNQFALSLRNSVSRHQFLENEDGYLLRFTLSEEERDLVRARDWTGLLQAGGHIQAILKLAATVGQNLYDIGAHNAGVDRDALYESCPRRVAELGGLDG
jgi:protocatechuate 4,5-dioxygenase, alpha chain